MGLADELDDIKSQYTGATHALLSGAARRVRAADKLWGRVIRDMVPSDRHDEIMKAIQEYGQALDETDRRPFG